MSSFAIVEDIHMCKGLNRLHTKSVFQSMFQSEGTNIGLPVVITNIREVTGDIILVNSNAVSYTHLTLPTIYSV